MSLFTMELERWALNLHLLISLVPTGSFEFRDLQVRALAESLLFGGLHSAFGHLEGLHEHFGVSWGPGRTFQGITCTLGAPVG